MHGTEGSGARRVRSDAMSTAHGYIYLDALRHGQLDGRRVVHFGTGAVATLDILTKLHSRRRSVTQAVS